MRSALLSAGIALLATALLLGQSAETLTFEVASVKPSAPVPMGGRVFFGPPRGGPGTPDPGQITWTYATLKNLLMTAYDVKAYQVSGPDWLNTERYDIVAKLPAEATTEQLKVMWRNLLAERFGVTLHRESREFEVEELVVAKGGPKLKAAEADPTALMSPEPPRLKDGELSGPELIAMISSGPNGPTASAVAKAQPLSKLTEMLANQLRRPVLDKTGLAGTYDFKLEFTPDLSGSALAPRALGTSGTGPVAAPGDNGSTPEPNIAEAVQEQLGLKLIKSKAMLDVVVIDKAEKAPTPN